MKGFSLSKTSGFFTWLSVCSSAIVVAGLVFALVFPQAASAQTIIGTQSATINATIPDTPSNNDPPGVVILITPQNNAIVNTNKPTLTWKRAEDPTGIKKYTLSLDGSVLFDDIPTSATENSEYVLKYDSNTEYYSLTPKDSFVDGAHTWKVRAENNVGLGTNSATWNFTIDTLAPPFVVTNIGNVTTSISAQDPSTVPAVPIELSANEPLIVAAGEANATVTMTVIIPGDPIQSYTSDISAQGTWGQQLGTLPRDVVMLLNFVIVDQAGQVSTLSDVPFIIPAIPVVFPPTTPPPPLPTPVTQPPPLLELRVIPGDEIIREIFQETQEVIQETTGPILQPVADLTSAAGDDFEFYLPQITFARTIPFLPLALTVFVPVVSTFTTTGGLSVKLLVRMLQALGIFPAGKPQGIVFDAVSHKPVSFALLTITTIDIESENYIQETVVTDVDGVYRGVKLQPDAYVIDVKHQEFYFPTKNTRPPYLTMKEFYKGEPFDVTSQRYEQLFLVPLDAKTAISRKSWLSRLRIALVRFNSKVSMLIIPLFLFALVMLILYPSIWNWFVVLTYAAILVKRALEWFKVPNFQGSIIDSSGQPVHNAVIRLSRPDTNELTALVTTNESGAFEAFVEKGKFQLSITKPGYIWSQNAAFGLFEVDLTTGSQNIVQTLSPAPTAAFDILA